MVSEADLFTALGYCRSREETPALVELEDRGARVIPGVTAALGDTYNVLWSDEAALKPSDQVKPSRQYWYGMLGQVVTTSAFEQLHAKTRGDGFMSVAGTIEAGKTILGLVPAEDADKLQQTAAADAEADQLEQAAQNAQAQADTLQELFDQMMATAQAGGGAGADSPQPGSGAPSGSQQTGAVDLTAAQAQALADKLAAAQAQARDTRAQADTAHQKAQQMVDTLMGQPGSVEAEQKLRQLARIGHAATAVAEKKVSEFSETVQCWGVEKGELHRMGMPEAFGLLERMRRSASFLTFAKLLGRLRAIAAKKARSVAEGEGRRMPRTEYGRDLARIHASELVALVHPATRYDAYQRWTRGELRLHGTQTKRTLGEGPVIVCEDASGSMDGAKQQWAKGITLALALYAKLRKRGFGWIVFDGAVRKAQQYPGGRITAVQMLEIAETRAGGGTNFELPLRRAIQMIIREGLDKADIVFVTDGDCAVSTEFLAEFAATKARYGFSVLAVICDAGGHVTDAAVKLFADRVERASSFTAEEAEEKVFQYVA
jgi:uncharacterized protein with von Willebrand factor type A (vWA) domain